MNPCNMPGVDDQRDRDRIRTELGTNFLVEAGAGSGKTTALVSRLLEHVRTGTPVERLAAVTFTRKAAGELRERFQLQLEQAMLAAPAGSENLPRYERALRELDRAFLGTIHAFCGRLLREHPLEAALDPTFQEVTEGEWTALRDRFWRRWVERARGSGDPDLRALQAVGIQPAQLRDGFKAVMTYPDVVFPLGASALPDIAPCRRQLDALLVTARTMMPASEPADGWDSLMHLVRQLEFQRDTGDWGDVATFCQALQAITIANCNITQKRWSDTKEGKAAAKELGQCFLDLLDGPVADLLRCWREHRYPVAMRILRRASEAFARERRATGQLGFEDLLLLAARLLREHPAVRDELGARHAHLLVDEFQDTDPVQAEICFLLASDATEGPDWRAVAPRPGSLFAVGDPKQSIYRFRRADIQVYEQVKQRIRATGGSVLSLTRTFRSVDAIAAVVNGHFAANLPATSSAEQAAYSAMWPVKQAAPEDGVYRYIVRPDRNRNECVIALDAALLASWIAECVRRGEWQPGDFLILTARKKPIASYARALAERNVPVATTGAPLPQGHELQELLVVLRAIGDPENPIAVVAALEGLFFGLSPAELWAGSRLGLRLAITHRPATTAHAVGHALGQLHEWWRLAQRHPIDVLLERILGQTGLLFHAAGPPLGEARAGALVHISEVLRAASVAGASGVPEAVARLEALLLADAADAPLRPGRRDAVRVMNLHKAKGLEAEVVVLAAPEAAPMPAPAVHIARTADGAATGGLVIRWQDGRRQVVLAHPPGWCDMEAAEVRFAEAERVRLRYVAATRARRMLVVAQAEEQLTSRVKPDAALWRPLAPVLEAHARVLPLEVSPPPEPCEVTHSVASLRVATEEAAWRVAHATRSSLRIRTVTEEAKDRTVLGGAPMRTGAGGDGAGYDGAAWGRAMHRSIEALGRGRRGEALRTFVHAVAREEGLPNRAEALHAVVERVAASAIWRSLTAAGPLVPEFTIMRCVAEGGAWCITEGVMDAVARDADGWRIVDWKTDQVDDATWAARSRQYGTQVRTYAALLEALTGVPATGTIERVRG